MLSLAITTIIELFCLAPRSHWIPYRSTPLGCIRLLGLSASLQRRAACPQAGAVAFVACSYRRKPTNAPAASSRAESPRPRIGFYYRLWLRTARQRAALLQSTALRPSRHAVREKASRAGRAGTKAACPLTQWGNSGASRPYGVPANAPLLSLPRPLSFVPALSPCAACLSSSRATWLRHYVDWSSAGDVRTSPTPPHPLGRPPFIVSWLAPSPSRPKIFSWCLRGGRGVPLPLWPAPLHAALPPPLYGGRCPPMPPVTKKAAHRRLSLTVVWSQTSSCSVGSR